MLSSVVTFDIPMSWTNKYCEFILKVPHNSSSSSSVDLEKPGALFAFELEGPVEKGASYNSLPARKTQLSASAVNQTGKRWTLDSRACVPGKVSFELVPKFGLCLDFGQSVAEWERDAVGVFALGC